jgi:hypothetical protein
LAHILSDDRISFIILKYSQGVGYGPWAEIEGPKIRASRAVLGGYHMLDGTSGSGTEQANYFLGKYKPKPGDIVPIVDFEGSGQGGASLGLYKAKLLDFIKQIHARGFKCMLYGHSTVKEAFSDWRASGADYWWVPGDSPHSDVGPRGPDLWQYCPYTFPAGFPQHPAGNSSEDVSKIITKLPVIAGKPKPNPGDDMTDAEKAELKAVAEFLKAIRNDLGTVTHPNQPATVAGAAARIAKAVKETEKKP